MPIIGLTGFAGTGKDLIAGILVRHHGFKRIALADPLREMLMGLNPIVDQTPWSEGGNFVRVSDLVRGYGWDEAKRKIPEIRQLLQRMGTEAGRKVLGEDIWLRVAHEKIPWNEVHNHNLGIVIPDVRFKNEADWVHNIGGKVVRIARPNYGPVNDHASDAGISEDLIDWTIDNGVDMSYDPEHIRNEVDQLLAWKRI